MALRIKGKRAHAARIPDAASVSTYTRDTPGSTLPLKGLTRHAVFPFHIHAAICCLPRPADFLAVISAD